MNKVILMAISN